MQIDWNKRKPLRGLFRTPTWASFRLFRNTSIIGLHDVMWKRSTQWKALIVHIHSHSLMQAPLRAVYMTPEWLLSRYHIGSTVRFVLHSHNKTDGLSMVFAYSCASRLRLQHLRYSVRKEVRFQNAIPYKNVNFFWNENRNGLIYGEKHYFVRVSSEQMQRNMWRWNDLVPEWNSLRYQVNSPLNCCWGQCNEYLPEYDMVDGMYEELVVGAIAEK